MKSDIDPIVIVGAARTPRRVVLMRKMA